MGRLSEGEQACRRASELYQREGEALPQGWQLARFVATYYHDLANPDPREMLEMAEFGVEWNPQAHSWHTLGMARYRVGDWPGAIDALKRSREIAPGGADAKDCFFFVAMAWWQLGDQEKARSWYNAAVKRLEEEINPNNNEWYPDFIRFRAEAEELMGGERNRSGGE